MIWIRSLLIGIAAAIVTAVITVIALSVLAPPVMMWWADFGEGTGSIGAFSWGIELVLLPATLAFALAFWWSTRSARRKRPVTGA
jgi:hypothetical protein